MSNNYYQSPRNSEENEDLTKNDDELQKTNSISSLNIRTNIYPLGEILHVSQLVDQLSGLFLDGDYSDITLCVEDQRFPAHRVILAARSNYFRAMLYGGLRESRSNEITLIDTSAIAFKILLKYIYTGRLLLRTLDFNLVLDLLELVHKYGFTELETTIPEFLKSTLKNHNVCSVFCIAHQYSIGSLLTACLDFIDNCASEIVYTKPFIELPAQALIKIIGRNSFCCPEIDIFAAVKQWIEAHPNEANHFPSILAQIRLPLIKFDDLFSTVRDSGLISADCILDAIKDQKTLRTYDLKCRGFLLPGTNIATPVYGAKVITGDFRTALLANQNYEDEGAQTYAKHLINQRDTGITIELGQPFIINGLRLHLMDRDQRAYSYYIEVSVDGEDWLMVIDHSHYLCRSKQNLFFEERVIKFIRIMGTHCSVNNTFQLGSFEALYSTEQFEIDRETTLQIPRQNVATAANGAIVIEGVSRTKNALLNGDTSNYDWDNGYTCHQIGSGALEVQLPLPYVISTMRLLLWDCDDRNYSFYIEVSTDQNKWLKVAEFNECKSWQTLRFDSIPVVFVRIVGTYNSANEVFHCVHFECPAIEMNATSEEDRPRKLLPSQPSTSGTGNVDSRKLLKVEAQTAKKDEGNLTRERSAFLEIEENHLEHRTDIERSQSEPAQHNNE